MIRDAASIILLRQTASGFELFLVKRNRGASFMASASVFPGGAAEPGEENGYRWDHPVLKTQYSSRDDRIRDVSGASVLSGASRRIKYE